MQHVTDLADTNWWFEHRIVAPAQVRRMLDVEFISELMLGLVAGPQDKKGLLDEFYYTYNSDWDFR